MLRYRTKANLILVFLALTVTTFILCLHMGYLIMGTMKSQRIYMETICQNIQEALSQEDVTLETLLEERVANDLWNKVESLLFNDEKLKKMAAAAKGLGMPDAADRIAKAILEMERSPMENSASTCS